MSCRSYELEAINHEKIGIRPMDLAQSPTTVVVARDPIRATLVPFPIVCFTLVLLTDIAFWQTSNLMWQNFSSWLLLAGLVFGGLAFLAGLIALPFRSKNRVRSGAWTRAIGALIVLALAFVNSFVHARDGWTAVVPTGLILSAVTVIVMLIVAWLGRPPAVQPSAGVNHHA